MIQAGIHHAAVLAAIHAEIFPDDPWSEPGFLRLLGQPGVAGFIDERGGIAMIRCVADEAEILTLGAIIRRQGIGTALLRTAIAHAGARAAKKLHLEVAASNAAAFALYRSLGFEPTGRRRNYYADGDALILSLTL